MTSKNQQKEKLLKETLCYLPRVLFFNAFELGTEILKDARISATEELEERESIKKQIRNKFKSKPLPIKKSLVKKQVMKAQSNQHRKAKQVQLQEFQHKEGKLNIVEIHKTIFPSLIITFSSIINRINTITIT
jgi:hypothetical protein